jgi:8-amino-7-oxononanoate synthase
VTPGINALDATLQEELETLRDTDLLRTMREVSSISGARLILGGREYLNFASNDYLGLSQDPRVKLAATEAIQRFGVGSGASRLLAGTQSPHVELEKQLAAFKGKPAAVVFSSGYAAHLGTLPALVGNKDWILCDKLNHASIIDAARLSGATLRIYPHGNLKKLRDLLVASKNVRRRLIVTETLFSMDGDFAPLADIVTLKEEFGAWLMIDEAHATGIFGKHRRGVAEMVGVEDQVEVTMGTLSKALGTLGGYVVGSQALIDTLVNRARSFVYSTAPPAAVCAAARAALAILIQEPEHADRLLKNARFLRDGLHATQENRAVTPSPILPFLVGESKQALELSRKLFSAGFFVPAIRPPTVPRGTARLRVTVSAAHRQEDLENLLETLNSTLQH